LVEGVCDLPRNARPVIRQARREVALTYGLESAEEFGQDHAARSLCASHPYCSLPPRVADTRFLGSGDRPGGIWQVRCHERGRSTRSNVVFIKGQVRRRLTPSTLYRVIVTRTST